MKSTFFCHGKLLIVGDGDFSFTVSLIKNGCVDPHQVFTSNLETEASILHHAQATDNMSNLKLSGVSVLLETDATDLHNHPVISKERFDHIVFNFPLADRHNIKKNRSLLADFFSSCRSVLAPGGRVCVTLCKGQGGTPADQPVRSWHDSWQVVAMATNASFLLHKVVPFEPAEFPEYHSVGFRFQDKSFNVTGALTHVFVEGISVEDGDVSIRGAVCWDGQSYSCSSYVASHLKRNLLEETRNPISILKRHMEAILGNHVLAKRFGLQNGCTPVIPSHKSKTYFHNEEEDPLCATVMAESEFQSDEINDKDWKNCENLKRMAKAQLAHGVISNTNDDAQDLICSENMATTFIPRERENVYILVKAKDSKVKDVGDGMKDVQGSLTAITESLVESTSSIYHCRTSLLENLPSLCQIIKGDKKDYEQNISDSLSMDIGDTDKSASSTNSSLSMCESDEVSRTPFSCLVTSGQSMLPCHITPRSSPIKHEMLIVHQINENDLTSQSLHEEPTASKTPSQSHFDLILSQIASFLHSLSSSLSLNISLSAISEDSSCKVRIEGMDELRVVSQINVTYSNNGSATSPAPDSSQVCDWIGLVLQAKMEGCSYHVTLMDLQRLACCLFGIDDWRLLCSCSDKFLDQFHSETNSFSFCKYRPFSLYPMRFAHDLSFWEQGREADGGSAPHFDVFALYEAIRSVAGDLVNNVTLMDIYEDGETGRKSRCYRLHFQSSDRCLPYVTSWKMQSKIRMEVSRSLGVQLR